MPTIEKIEAVAAKLNSAAGSEPAPNEEAAAPPAGPSLGAGSAPAAETGDGGDAPEDPAARAATIDASAIEKKLAADRERRREKEERKRLAEERAAVEKARQEAEETKKAAAAELEKVKGMSWLERAKADGRDPRQFFEEMKDEALRAGTPEAILDKVQKLFEPKLSALQKQLEEERAARAKEREEREAERQREHQAFQAERFRADFDRGVANPDFESLRDEYDDEQLFGIVDAQRRNPQALFNQAKALGVRLQWEEEAAALAAAGGDLTELNPTFTMVDILKVLKATQDRHFARLEEQRRKRQAATQTATGAPEKKAPVKSQPTVNGTAERKAGMGNELAATTAAKAPGLKGLSREERVRRLGEKYG